MDKVQSGKSLQVKAADYNGFVDAAMDYKRRASSQGTQSRPTILQPGIVLVKNTSGQPLARFAAVGFDGALIEPGDNLIGFHSRVALKAVSPEWPRDFGAFGIMLEPLAEDAFGLCQTDGMVQVQLVVGEENGEDKMQFADIGSGSALSAKVGGTARIIWKEETNEEEFNSTRWAVVRLNDWSESSYHAKVGEEGIGGADPMGIGLGEPGAGEVELLDHLGAESGITLGVKNAAGEIPADTYVLITRDAYGRWWVSVAPCEEDEDDEEEEEE